jgi:hypothetical protein
VNCGTVRAARQRWSWIQGDDKEDL